MVNKYHVVILSKGVDITFELFANGERTGKLSMQPQIYDEFITKLKLYFDVEIQDRAFVLKNLRTPLQRGRNSARQLHQSRYYNSTRQDKGDNDPS